MQLSANMRIRVVAAGLLCLFAGFSFWPAHAEACYPLQLSLATPVQIAPKESDVCGVRLDLFWGENKAVWGIDAGLANGAESIRGIEAGALFNRLWNTPKSPATGSWGVQMAGFVNSNAGAGFAGIQAAGLVNDHDDASFMGIQLAGVVNDNDNAVYKGVQAALFSNQNYESEVTGLQVAMFNQAKKFKGVQMGLGNGVSAAEGAVATIVVPIVVAGAVAGAAAGRGGGAGHLPLYHDPHAHYGATMNGVQLGVFTNIVEDMQGLQVSLFLNVASNSMRGIQIGTFNGGVTPGTGPAVSGLQIGASANFANEMTGLQVGTLNNAGKASGVQIGFINICRNLKGLQIGALNIVTSRFHTFPGSVPFAPVINVGY